MTSAAPQTYSLAVLMDEKRLGTIKGTALEGQLTDMFGGAIKAFILQVPAEKSKVILEAFPRSRIDARGFLEELPVSFKRVLFEEIAKSKSIGPEVFESVLGRLDHIKEEASKEEDRLTPPSPHPPAE